MKNILLFAGIAALAFQDYFKKQPVKTTRKQQFFQTGGTSQAFIAGEKSVFTTAKKILTKYLGKPSMTKKGLAFYKIKIGNNEIIVWTLIGSFNRVVIQIYTLLNGSLEQEQSYYIVNNMTEDFDNSFKNVISEIFKSYYKVTDNEDYLKLENITNSGDWELALEIAKSQDLL